jgi:hypothetical protein
VCSTSDKTPKTPNRCTLSVCDGTGAVRASGGKILRTCECPVGRQRAQRFAAARDDENRAKAEKAPPTTTGPLAELATAVGAALPRDDKPERRYPCRRCQAPLTASTRLAHQCTSNPTQP